MRTARTRTWRTALCLALLGGAGCGAGQQPAQSSRLAAAEGAVPAPAPPTAAFPLHVEAGKRYLLDARGHPFLLQGDAAWSLIAQLTREQAIQYLEDRQARGFNAVLVNLIEHKFARRAPRDAYGEPPFLSSGDFTRPNPRYFAHAEAMIAEAERRGILVLLAPAYLGFGGGDEGWYEEMKANGPAALHAYGRYVANALRTHDNILWVEGGDFDPPDQSLVRAVAEGIREINTDWLHTYHGARNTAAAQFVGTGVSWLQVNDIYTSEDTVVDSARTEYARSEMPFFLIEARYEGEGYDARIVRRQAWQAMLSGACGQVVGNKPIWDFESGWEKALGSAGARGSTLLGQLLLSTGWPDLLPDARSALVTGNVGSGGPQVTAARSRDGSRAIIHVPDGRSIRIDLGQMAGPEVRMQWFNTVTGALTAVPGGPVRTSGEHTLPPPDSGRAADWVMVLESTGNRN